MKNIFKIIAAILLVVVVCPFVLIGSIYYLVWWGACAGFAASSNFIDYVIKD